MNYFIDTEFLEGTQTKRILGIPYGKTKPTIDLISLAIVAEDGREYYAISKDFNLKEAWNRYDLDYGFGDQRINPPRKVYWIRENVLRPMFDQFGYGRKSDNPDKFFTEKGMQIILNSVGKSNEQIAEEVISFVNGWHLDEDGSYLSTKNTMDFIHSFNPDRKKRDDRFKNPTFYAYYADYDWVVFCWLFGKMIDLPTGFPMYCRDLKQMLDEKAELLPCPQIGPGRLDEQLDSIKRKSNYPKQSNEHNALAEARWNHELYKFIHSL